MLLRRFFFWLSTKKRAMSVIAHYGMRYGFAQRFVAGETLAEAMGPAAELCRAGRRVILNLLGENVDTPQDARRAHDTYIEMLNALDRAGLDGNIAIKLTQLGLDFDRELCLSLAQDIAAKAAALQRTIEIDMESSAYAGMTLDIFEQVHGSHGNAGVAIQAYLRRSASDIERLAQITVPQPSEPRGRTALAGSHAPADSPKSPQATEAALPKVRLVKGAYLEPPSIAFPKKSEVDANYQKLIDRLLSPPGPNRKSQFFAAIGTHDPVLIDHACDTIARHGLASDVYEFQMIYGIRRDLQQQLFDRGQPLRVYVPFGTAWCPYFMRRLAERPANLWFVLRSLFAEHKVSAANAPQPKNDGNSER
jgi:proline dehydrogenase